MTMIHKAAAILVAGMALTLPALAQTPPPPPEGEDNRYMYNRVQDGFLRLDTRTGQVSLCSRRPVGWACHVVPDERTALEGEIARLQTENATLKKELVSRGLDLPAGMRAEANGQRPRDPDLRLPNNADLDRVVTFIEKAWRRLVEMIVNLQKDVLKGS
jgi:hypothetical protein